MSHFGDHLKKLRQESDLTMQLLADKATVSKSMICKIENNEVQPTIDVAARLANALGKSLSEMLHATQTKQIVFLPKSEQAVWKDTQNIKRRNISPVFEGHDIEWLQVELPVGATVAKGVSNEKIEKYILVTKGCLETKISGQRFRLKKGDSLYFDASSAHKFVNAGKEIVEYYLIIKHQ